MSRTSLHRIEFSEPAVSHHGAYFNAMQALTMQLGIPGCWRSGLLALV